MRANTSYKSFSPALVSMDIGLHIGLAGVNVSLRGESDVPICSSDGPKRSGRLWSPQRLLSPAVPGVPVLLTGSTLDAGTQQDLALLPPSGNPVNQVNETINYNEHFPWSFNADYDQSYSQGLERGLPRPILYVAEKFTTRSPCSMQRQYRISSHYATATLW